MNGAILLLGAITLLGVGLLLLADHRGQRREWHLLHARMQKQPAAVAASAGGDTPGIAPPERFAKWPGWLRVSMARADVMPDLTSLTRLGLASLALAALFAWRLGWLGGIAGLLLGLACGPLALRLLAARRIRRFIEGLPFFFDAIRQMMMAGSSLQQALVRATENADAGMRRYLDPVVRRMQNGAAVGESLGWQAGRLDLAELHMFAVAVQASMQYGGRLSVVLGNLAATVRDNVRVSRELRSATAEMRVSAYIVGALPVASGVVMGLANPSYARFFIEEPIGHELLAFAVALQLLGVFAMRQLMRLDY